MKLLLAILLFAILADANAQNTIVHDTDGTPWVLQKDTVRKDKTLVLGLYHITAVEGVIAAGASGCAAGQGLLHLRSPEAGRQFAWSYKGRTVIDYLAIVLCAEGLSK